MYAVGIITLARVGLSSGKLRHSSRYLDIAHDAPLRNSGSNLEKTLGEIEITLLLSAIFSPSHISYHKSN
jgi:hypothetical protein